MLVAFISDPETETTKDRDAPVERIPFSAEVAAIMSEMDDRLKVVLPKYMVPAAYIPINHMPALVSGKTDRKVLRQVGATMMLQDLDIAWQPSRLQSFRRRGCCFGAACGGAGLGFDF